MKPTDELYQSLEYAYQYFNQALFDEKLPPVLFTLQRQKGTLGYFVADRWTSPSGDFCHEISINPAHMGASRVIDVFQTLVHEMVHCWQFCFGTMPTQKGYHNKEWAYKMMAIGLQPSATGEPDGAIIGYQMSDYIIKNGEFEQVCYRLIQQKEFQIPWIYRLTYTQDCDPPPAATLLQLTDSIAEAQPTKSSLSSGYGNEDVVKPDLARYLYSKYSDLMPDETFFSQPVKKNTKEKYQCPSCYLNVWAKSNVRLMCVECGYELLVK